MYKNLVIPVIQARATASHFFFSRPPIAIIGRPV